MSEVCSTVRLFRLVAAIGAVAITLGCSMSGQPNNGSSVTPRSTAHLSSPSPLADPPVTCVTGGSPEQLNPAFGPGIGGSPVWVISGTTIHVGFGDGTLRGVTYTNHGWSVKVLWVIEPSYSHTIRVSGAAVDTGEPLWFQFNGQESPTTSAVLDPSKPPTGAGGWPGFPSNVFIPRAACYNLTATWPQGHWKLVVAAGL